MEFEYGERLFVFSPSVVIGMIVIASGSIGMSTEEGQFGRENGEHKNSRFPPTNPWTPPLDAKQYFENEAYDNESNISI